MFVTCFELTILTLENQNKWSFQSHMEWKDFKTLLSIQKLHQTQDSYWKR